MSTDTKTYKVTHSDEEWRKLLTPEQYQGDARARDGAAGELCAAAREAAGDVRLRRLRVGRSSRAG